MDGEAGPYFDAAGLPVFSTDGLHFGFRAGLHGRWFPVIDGVKGPEHDEVGGVEFTGDGQAHVYTARDGEGWHLVANGVKGEAYDSIGRVFPSPVGNRLLYFAKRRGRYFAVLDGSVSEPLDGVESPTLAPPFSADGRHVVYIGKDGGAEFAVVDGVRGAPFDMIDHPSAQFSEDGNHINYFGRKEQGHKEVLVMDGREYDLSRQGWRLLRGPELVYSRDMSRAAILARRTDDLGGAVHVLVNERENGLKVVGRYESAGGIRFSPDGRYLAYCANGESRSIAVVNGVEIPAENILSGVAGVSVIGVDIGPDSKRVVYTMYDGRTMWVVRDKAQDEPVQEVTWDITFSPDSAHVAYVGVDGPAHYVVLDGKRSDPFDAAGMLTFSADSRHLCFAAQIGRELWWKVLPTKGGDGR